MTYQVTYTETTNPAKAPIVVQDQVLNNQTNLTFVGKNYSGYAPLVAANFLHLLENFAAPTAPGSANSAVQGTPVQGQLWFDNSTGQNILKVFDGTQWTAAGAVKKATSAPTGLTGDLWIDTNNKQLYIYSGSTWLLVGPQFASGTKTGPQAEVIIDTSNPPVSHNVITLYANNTLQAIISADQFTPKTTLAGFSTIYPGVNIANVNAAGSTVTEALSVNKFWGTAKSADNLNIANTVVSASNFLRSDQTSTTNFPLQVNNSGGIRLGSSLNFSITSDNTQTLFYSSTPGTSINFQVNNNADGLVTLLHLDPNEYVGIGKNNTNPLEVLDVAGNIRATGEIYNQSNLDSTKVGSGALVTTGGLSVNLNSNFGASISIYAPTTAPGTQSVSSAIYLNNLVNGESGAPQAGPVIMPGSDAAAHLYDIGTASRPFRNVYADTFTGAFTGSVTGTVTGNITGSAGSLSNSTAFSLAGDVTAPAINFNGAPATGTVAFQTTVGTSIITGKTALTDSLLGDQLLVYRNDQVVNGATVAGGLRQTTKAQFLSNVATVPVGAIMPFAGPTPPKGYVLCDGSEVPISTYPQLYAVIGYTYKLPINLQGQNTFGLPDLRGRFPLGADNMNNNITVPSKSDAKTNITTINTPAGNVTDITARVLGNTSGNSIETLAVSNLPQHTHSLSSGNAQYYAVGLPGATGDGLGTSNVGPPTSTTGLGYGSSGNVNSSSIGQPFSLMNPYQTINYIIFTGAL